MLAKRALLSQVATRHVYFCCACEFLPFLGDANRNGLS